MNAIATSPERCTAARSTSLRSYHYVLFLFCAGLYLLPFMRLIIGDGGDEGTLAYGAVRILHGQVFARDFFEVMGPGTFYWLATFFKLFGQTFAVERLCLFITSLGTGALMYFLSHRVCRGYQALPALVLVGTSFGGIWPAISHHTDSNFMALLAFTCLVLWQDTRQNVMLFAAGALAGIATCILQPKGLFLFFAFAVWLLFENRRRKFSGWTPLLLVAGYVSVVGITLAYFWSHHALGSLIYANFMWPSRHYSSINNVPYAWGIRQYWWDPRVKAFSSFRWGVALVTVLITPFVFIATLPILLSMAAVLRRAVAIRAKLLPYWLCGWAVWFSELHRADITHLVCGAPLLVIGCVSLLSECPSRIERGLLQVLSTSGACLAIFNLMLALTAHTATTRSGPIAVFIDNPATTFVSGHVAPGDEVYFYPYSPMNYFLTATTNPTRFSLLMYNYNTASEFRESIEVLEQHKVKYVLWDTKFETVMAPTFFRPDRSMLPDSLIMEPYLESHYKLLKSVDTIRIMERKSGNSSN